MGEHHTGMNETVEVEYAVVLCGRRPHGYLHIRDVLKSCRAGRPARRRSVLAAGWSGGLGLDLAHLACASAGNSNAAWLHGLGDLALKLDDQKAVLEAGTLNLDVVGQGELALERTARDAAMQVGLLVFLGFAPFQRQDILLHG